MILIPTLNQTNIINLNPQSPPLEDLIQQTIKMKIMLWNCRGMLNTNFHLVFKELQDCHKLDMVILTKTKLPTNKELDILTPLGFSNHTLATPLGLSRGIVLLWN